MASVSRNPLVRLASSLHAIQQRHEERHRPSGFRFAFADSVDFLHPEHWDAVAAQGGFFLRRNILRVLETQAADNVTNRYALIYRGPQPAAIVAAQIVGVTGKDLRSEKKDKQPRRNLLKQALRPAAKIATAKLNERVLVAGNLFSWGFDGIAFAAGEEPACVWPGVAEALYRIRRAERLTGQTNFVMVKDLTPQQTGVEVLRRFSYRPLDTEPNMVLEIRPEWRCYDDYLAALDAKYRRSARDHMKKLAAAGCVIERITDLNTCAPRLHGLYLSVHDNASVRLVTLREGYFAALAAAGGDDFRCTVVRRGEEILGFVTTIRDGDTAIAYYIGFDREAAAAGVPLYLRLLHTSVSDAIDWGCKRLSLGRTALDPKAGLGAKPEPMSVWLRHRVPTLNWMIRGVLGAVPHAQAPERNPFKSVEQGGARGNAATGRAENP
jgi:hypothetical protein